MSTLNKPIIKDIEYFQKNLSRPVASNQVVNYTWEKPGIESPSIYTRINELKDNENRSIKSTHQHTLDQMATYKGIPHIVKQNKWETDPSEPPKFLLYPQQRRAATLSSMTQYFLINLFLSYDNRSTNVTLIVKCLFKILF